MQLKYSGLIDKSLPYSAAMRRNQRWILLTMGVVLQSIFWSWRTNGILQATAHWNATYPFGYKFLVRQSEFHIQGWPTTKEQFWYMLFGHMALLKKVHLGNRLYGDRILFAFLTKMFWFLGPIFAGIVVNTLLWISCVFAADAAAKGFGLSRTGRNIAAILTATGIGFAHSVGEHVPHMTGYAFCFGVVALAARLKLWTPNSPLRSHALVYAICGFGQLAGYASLLYLPLLLTCTALRISHEAKQQLWGQPRLISRGSAAILVLTLLALAFSRINLWIQWFHRDGSEFSMLNSQLPGFSRALAETGVSNVITQIITQGLLDGGILSWAPFILIAIIGGFAAACIRRNFPILGLGLLWIFLTLGTAPMITPPITSAFKGYVIFNFAILIYLVAAYGLQIAWESRKSGLRLGVVLLLLLNTLWTQAPLFGQRFPLYAFQFGTINTLQNDKYQSYEIHTLD